MVVADLVKDIEAKKLKALEDRLKKEKPNQRVPSQKNSYTTPLIRAVDVGFLAGVEALLKAGAEVDGVDSSGCTALHIAAARSAAADAGAIAEALLKKKANASAANKSKLTPLHVAAGADGNDAVLSALLKAKADVEAVGGADGCTPLLAAAKAGRSAAVAALTAAGAKLGIKDAKGWTPLMHLVAAGKVADAQTLLQAASSGGGNGACINAAATEPAGTTALSLAIDQAYSGAAAGSTSDADRLSFVSLLLDHGADPDAPAASGTSSSSSSSSSPQADSLVLAAMRQQRWPLAKLLLAKSAKASAKGASGDTVMSLAVAAEQGELIELAIAQGADVSGPEGRKLLEAALAGGRDAVAAALAGAVPSSVLTELKLEYKGLLAKGMTKTALAVLRATAGDSLAAAVDVDGNTQLHHMAAEGGSYDLCLGLARLGINPNVLNKENDTALHIAARAGHMEVLRALVDAGADPLRRNGKNRLPGSQLKLSAEVKEFLEAAEERAKEAKEAKRSELWDGKMRAAQTESACIVRGL